MKTSSIEVHARPTQRLGMSAARFLREHWQKRPLLIRGFLAGGVSATTPNDLAGLACEEAAASRIVTHDGRRDRWDVRNGPFAEKDFAKLGKQNWTLLVQDVDKWDVDVAALLDHFAFIPSWRVDDVMVSYATAGGGVGPHVDNYDVFLIQGLGQRRWRISNNSHAPRSFRKDSELKLLSEFVATHEWTLDSGDALYLPPGFGHHGVAVGECLTYSVGMRAPSQAELLLDFAEFLAEPLSENLRYADPALTPARDPTEIDAAAIDRVIAAMPHFTHVDKSTIAHWFGCYITRYRSAQMAASAERELSPAQVAKRLAGATLLRNPFSRFAWRKVARAAELFVAGEAWPCPVKFAQRISATREIDGDALLTTALGSAALATLTALINSGHLQFARRRR